MKLNEFKPNTEIIITVEKQHKHREVKTTIIDSNEYAVTAEPVVIQDRVVNFHEDTDYMISVNTERKVYLYKQAKVKIIKLKSARFKHNCVLNISTDEDVKAINRRDFYRVFLGIEGTIARLKNNNFFQATIKDVSANGLGVICSNTLRLDIGSEIVVDFTDKMTGEKFKLTATIVRCVKNDPETFLYGCQFPEEDSDVEKFVALQQRLHIL